MNCPECKKKTEVLRTGIKNGEYVSERCDRCFANFSHISLYARKYDRDRGREDYRKDIIQRFEGDKINPEFIEAYPEQSRKEFGDDSLRGYTDKSKLL